MEGVSYRQVDRQLPFSKLSQPAYQQFSVFPFLWYFSVFNSIVKQYRPRVFQGSPPPFFSISGLIWPPPGLGRFFISLKAASVSTRVLPIVNIFKWWKLRSLEVFEDVFNYLQDFVLFIFLVKSLCYSGLIRFCAGSVQLQGIRIFPHLYLGAQFTFYKSKTI